ncbi:MAG: hypothetical protein Q8R92_21130 [Deltaproteobacteria bacterium]|nr:hypothetical protein [Deltaproteobacteria bacterium]
MAINDGGPKRHNQPTGMQILSTDLNRISRYLSRALLEVLRRVYQDQSATQQDGVLYGLTVSLANSGEMAVDVAPGLGFVRSADPAADNTLDSDYLWSELFDAATDASIDPGDAANPRKDAVYLEYGAGVIDQEQRTVKNPVTGEVANALSDVSRGPRPSIGVAKGTPASAPSVPSVPSGAIRLATITVPAGAVAPGELTVADARNMLPTPSRPNNVLATSLKVLSGLFGLDAIGNAVVAALTAASATVEGGIDAGGNINSDAHISAAGNVAAGNNVNANGDVNAGGGVIAQGPISGSSLACSGVMEAALGVQTGGGVVAQGAMYSEGFRALVAASSADYDIITGIRSTLEGGAGGSAVEHVSLLHGLPAFNQATAVVIPSIAESFPPLIARPSNIDSDSVVISIRRADGASLEALDTDGARMHVLILAHKS